jgi:hypothetical protein
MNKIVKSINMLLIWSTIIVLSIIIVRFYNLSKKIGTLTVLCAFSPLCRHVTLCSLLLY